MYWQLAPVPFPDAHPAFHPLSLPFDICPWLLLVSFFLTRTGLCCIHLCICVSVLAIAWQHLVNTPLLLHAL